MATGLKKLRDPSERVARRLLAEGRITRDLHDSAARHRNVKGLRFEEALIEAGLPEDQLLRVLAEMYRVQYISTAKLSAAAVDKRTLALVPAAIAEQRQAVPVLLDRQRSVLTVVISDPDDAETLKELEIATQVRTIRALVARPAAVDAAVRKFYQGDDFAFALLRNEKYDVAQALERDPIAALQVQRNETVLTEGGSAAATQESAPRSDTGRLSYPGAPRPSGQYAAQRTPTAETYVAPSAGVVVSRGTPVAPLARGVPRSPTPTPTAGPGHAPPAPARSIPAPTVPTRPTQPRPSLPTRPSAVSQRVALTPPPPPPEELDPADVSPLPMTLSPELVRSEPPASPSGTPPRARDTGRLAGHDRATPVSRDSEPPQGIGDPFQFAVLMVSLLEGNRKDLRGHSIQTARLVSTVCAKFDVPKARARAAEIAALIHDFGKASSYHLTPYNVARFDGHRAAAQKLYATPARVVDSAKLATTATTTVLHMYERYDGEGFPDSLKGQEIPLESRILAICDSYADLTNNPRNSFRRVLTAPEACEALRELQGQVFDPKVVNRFVHAVLGDEIAQRLRGDRGCVLLVDPDIEETTVLELALMEKRYDVHVVRGIEDAVHFVESAAVDIVLSEMDLEGGTGFELLQKIRARPGGESIPFVFLSEHTDATRVAEAIDGGAADYLFKPIATPVVVAKLRRLLEQSQSAKRVRGVSGSLEEMAIPDLVQILHQGRKTGALQLSSDGEQGSVFFKDGTIVDAIFRALRGEEAFYAIVGVSTGEFTIDPTVQPPEKVIQSSPEMLLLEGMRRLDEASR